MANTKDREGLAMKSERVAAARETIERLAQQIEETGVWLEATLGPCHATSALAYSLQASLKAASQISLHLSEYIAFELEADD